jgi:multidrug efflux pump subunit AcrA (membrane-fusion protein)
MSNEGDTPVEGETENRVDGEAPSDATSDDVELSDSDRQPEPSPKVKPAETQREKSAELTREDRLDQQARRLDERERGLDQLRNELDDREERLDDREEELRELREQLEDRREELTEYETELEQRTTELNSREAEIEETENALKQRENELDEQEAVLEMYVEDKVSEALDGRIDRVEKVVGERIAALESDISETIESEVSIALEQRETAGRFGVVGGTLLGLMGVGFVAVGVLIGVSGDVGWMPGLGAETATNLAGGVILFFIGLALSLTAAVDRL